MEEKPRNLMTTRIINFTVRYLVDLMGRCRRKHYIKYLEFKAGREVV